jgi:hypothetical protein
VSSPKWQEPLPVSHRCRSGRCGTSLSGAHNAAPDRKGGLIRSRCAGSPSRRLGRPRAASIVRVEGSGAWGQVATARIALAISCIRMFRLLTESKWRSATRFWRAPASHRLAREAWFTAEPNCEPRCLRPRNGGISVSPCRPMSAANMSLLQKCRLVRHVDSLWACMSPRHFGRTR